MRALIVRTANYMKRFFVESRFLEYERIGGCSGSKIMAEFLNYRCFLHHRSQIKVNIQKKEQKVKERSETMVA